jgi:hypothetical protein
MNTGHSEWTDRSRLGEWVEGEGLRGLAEGRFLTHNLNFANKLTVNTYLFIDYQTLL